jgi:hypothetical protein
MNREAENRVFHTLPDPVEPAQSPAEASIPDATGR